MKVFLQPKYFSILFTIIIFSNLFITAWYAINGDLYLQTDIARDFLLFEEVVQKKMVLIGPRAGAKGLFHGPLWLYINTPVYFLSNANPIAVEWYWYLLTVLALVGHSYIVKKLFGVKAVFAYALLFTGFVIPYIKEFTHPHAAMLLTPFFFYLLLLYKRTQNWQYLMGHFLIAGMLVQLEVASGGPLLALSVAYHFYAIIKTRRYAHLSLFLTLGLPFMSYFLFDLRHDFFQLKNLYVYIFGVKGGTVSFIEVIIDRLKYILGTSIPFAPHSLILGGALWVVSMICIYACTKLSNSFIYKIFLYFYFGYFGLSLFNRYHLLSHHFLPFVPVIFLIIASLVVTPYKKIATVLIAAFVLIHIYMAGVFLIQAQGFIGKNEDSWKFLSQIPKMIHEFPETSYGYFPYAPDKLAYEPKFLMVYSQRHYKDKKAYYFEKKPITYVISAPPPPNDPYMVDAYWIKNSIHITSSPTYEHVFENGYALKRYALTEEERSVPFDPQEDSGIHFR